MSSIGSDVSPLSSPAIGTGTNDLISPCKSRDLRPAAPPAVVQEPALALAFSGGGFRATLAGLGALRFVTDAHLLSQVRYVSSVSGGSLTNGLLACHYEELEKAGFSSEALDDIVVAPFVKRISRHSLSRSLLANIWRSFGPSTRTDLLARTFDRWFFGGRQLEDLSDQCRFIFNAANVTTGVRFGFERDVVGDWVMGLAPTAATGLRVAQAAAASAAVPGAFAPFEVKGPRFPCANGRVAKLLDGGAYDNSGMEVLDGLRDVLLVAVNAGGLFRTGAYGGVPIIRDLQRANSLLYRQSTGLRRREMVERFKAWEDAKAAGEKPPSWGRRGVLFGLATTFDAPAEWSESRPEHADWNARLAGYKTSFNRFPAEVCERLIYRGWWLAGATLTAYQRDVLPDELPAWRKLP